MKRTEYFKDQKGLDAYYPNGIPSNVLAVVGDEEEQILYTSTNNSPANIGTTVDQGGYNISPEDEEKLNDAYEFATTYGASKDYVAEYVSTYGGSVDLDGYATESYVVSKIEDVVGAAPAALDTLKEIGDSLNNDADFAGTMTAALAGKADKSELNSYVSYSYLENQHYLTVQAQADWSVESSISAAYIRNKPDLSNFATQSYVADYVSTYGGGEDNVQANWNESDSSSDAYIKNKPAISVGNINNSVFIGNVSKSDVNGLYSVAVGKWTTTKNQAEAAFGKYNKSTTDKTIFSIGIGEYVNRMNALEVMQNGDIYAYGVGNYNGSSYSTANTLAYVINDLQDQIDNIPSGGSQVQADWNESDSSSDAYIKNKPQDLVNQRMLDAVFSQNSMRSAEQYTYSGQVVDYISYLDFVHNGDLDNVAWFDTNEDFVDNGLTNIIDYNVDGSINGFLDTGTIVARYYQQNINDSVYEAAIGIGMVEYEDEDENIQRVPAVIDTHWEVPESNAKSPAPEPELKQTYKELATKEYVESLIGTALSLSEVIVGEETEPAVAKIILTDDNKINYEMNDVGDGVFSLTKNGAEWGYELWVDMYDEDDNLLGRYGVVGGALRTGDSAALELEVDGGEATQFDANGPVTVTVDTTAMEVSSANER